MIKKDPITKLYELKNLSSSQKSEAKYIIQTLETIKPYLKDISDEECEKIIKSLPYVSIYVDDIIFEILKG